MGNLRGSLLNFPFFNSGTQDFWNHRGSDSCCEHHYIIGIAISDCPLKVQKWYEKYPTSGHALGSTTQKSTSGYGSLKMIVDSTTKSSSKALTLIGLPSLSNIAMEHPPFTFFSIEIPTYRGFMLVLCMIHAGGQVDSVCLNPLSLGPRNSRPGCKGRGWKSKGRSQAQALRK